MGTTRYWNLTDVTTAKSSFFQASSSKHTSLPSGAMESSTGFHDADNARDMRKEECAAFLLGG